MSLRKPKRLLNYTSSIIFTSCYSNFWPFLVSISISPVSHTFGQTTKKPIFPEPCGWISILKDFANNFKGPRFHYGDVLHAWHDIDFNKSLNLSPYFSKSKWLCSFSFSSHFKKKKKKNDYYLCGKRLQVGLFELGRKGHSLHVKGISLSFLALLEKSW